MPFDHLDQPTLARLIPELLLCGHLIDRAGMPHAIGAFGREGMGEVAIEEWLAASPVYTTRMRDALGLEGDGVEELFKCLQHDVGAPPQFLDFRFTIHDEHSGEFALAFCGALADVEPMGEKYVETMCHAIEDPTFDATAIVTNPRARIRPVHRPPRVPADRHPHCAWTVTIDPGRDLPPFPEAALEIGATEAGRFPLRTPDLASDDGLRDYAGDFQVDVDWARFSRSLLLRLADEISLQWHLLALGFARAVRARSSDSEAKAMLRKQLTGIAGIGSRRLRDALGLPASPDSVAAVLAVHPVLNPFGYTGVTVDGDLIRVDRSAAGRADAGWVSLLDDEDLRPLEAMVHGVAPTLTVRDETSTTGSPDGDPRKVRIVDTGQERPAPAEVQLVELSRGAGFRLVDRSRSLPIAPF